MEDINSSCADYCRNTKVSVATILRYIASCCIYDGLNEFMSEITSVISNIIWNGNLH